MRWADLVPGLQQGAGRRSQGCLPKKLGLPIGRNISNVFRNLKNDPKSKVTGVQPPQCRG